MAWARDARCIRFLGGNSYEVWTLVSQSIVWRAVEEDGGGLPARAWVRRGACADRRTRATNTHQPAVHQQLLDDGQLRERRHRFPRRRRRKRHGDRHHSDERDSRERRWIAGRYPRRVGVLGDDRQRSLSLCAELRGTLHLRRKVPRTRSHGPPDQATGAERAVRDVLRPEFDPVVHDVPDARGRSPLPAAPVRRERPLDGQASGECHRSHG